MGDAQVEEEWTPLDDLVALHTAPDAGSPGRPSSSKPASPMSTPPRSRTKRAHGSSGRAAPVGGPTRRRLGPPLLGALVERARQAEPPGGAAIVHGVLDSAELLSPAARDAVVGVAATWPHRRLREAASALRNPPGPASADDPAASTLRRAPEPPGDQPSLF